MLSSALYHLSIHTALTVRPYLLTRIFAFSWICPAADASKIMMVGVGFHNRVPKNWSLVDLHQILATIFIPAPSLPHTRHCSVLRTMAYNSMPPLEFFSVFGSTRHIVHFGNELFRLIYKETNIGLSALISALKSGGQLVVANTTDLVMFNKSGSPRTVVNEPDFRLLTASGEVYTSMRELIVGQGCSSGGDALLSRVPESPDSPDSYKYSQEHTQYPFLDKLVAVRNMIKLLQYHVLDPDHPSYETEFPRRLDALTKALTLRAREVLPRSGPRQALLYFAAWRAEELLSQPRTRHGYDREHTSVINHFISPETVEGLWARTAHDIDPEDKPDALYEHLADRVVAAANIILVHLIHTDYSILGSRLTQLKSIWNLDPINSKRGPYGFIPSDLDLNMLHQICSSYQYRYKNVSRTCVPL